MISNNEQFSLIVKTYKIYNTGKIPKTDYIKDKELFRNMIPYNKFKNYTRENFISVLVYILLDIPRDFSHFIEKLCEVTKNDLLEAIKVKNIYINKKINPDISRINDDMAIYEKYVNKEISFFEFFTYFDEKYDDFKKIKGRNLKNTLKNISRIMMIFKGE